MKRKQLNFSTGKCHQAFFFTCLFECWIRLFFNLKKGNVISFVSFCFILTRVVWLNMKKSTLKSYLIIYYYIKQLLTTKWKDVFIYGKIDVIKSMLWCKSHKSKALSGKWFLRNTKNTIFTKSILWTYVINGSSLNLKFQFKRKLLSIIVFCCRSWLMIQSKIAYCTQHKVIQHTILNSNRLPIGNLNICS